MSDEETNISSLLLEAEHPFHAQSSISINSFADLEESIKSKHQTLKHEPVTYKRITKPKEYLNIQELQ